MHAHVALAGTVVWAWLICSTEHAQRFEYRCQGTDTTEAIPIEFSGAIPGENVTEDGHTFTLISGAQRVAAHGLKMGSFYCEKWRVARLP